MVIHKLTAGENTFYMLSEKRGRPAGLNSTLGIPEWLGSSQSTNLAERLSDVKFSKDVKEEAPPPDENTDKTSSLSGHIRVIARFLELSK